MKINESQLRTIIRNVIAEAVSETSPEKKGRAYVQARNDLENLRKQRESGKRTMKKGNRTVDISNEIKRKERQGDTFANGLSCDLRDQYGRDRGATVKRRIQWIEGEIQNCKEWMERNPNDDSIQRSGREKIQKYQAALEKERTNAEGWSVGSSDSHYGVYFPGGAAITSNYDSNGDGGQHINYSDPKDANRAGQLLNVTDRLMGADDDYNNGRTLDKRVDFLARRRDNASNYQQYLKDKDRWLDDKRKSQEAQREYDRQPFYKKWFSERPSDFTTPEPDYKWDDEGGGHYFFDTNPDNYAEPIARQQALNDRVRKAYKG